MSIHETHPDSEHIVSPEPGATDPHQALRTLILMAERYENLTPSNKAYVARCIAAVRAKFLSIELPTCSECPHTEAQHFITSTLWYCAVPDCTCPASTPTFVPISNSVTASHI